MVVKRTKKREKIQFRNQKMEKTVVCTPRCNDYFEFLAAKHLFLEGVENGSLTDVSTAINLLADWQEDIIYCGIFSSASTKHVDIFKYLMYKYKEVCLQGNIYSLQGNIYKGDVFRIERNLADVFIHCCLHGKRIEFVKFLYENFTKKNLISFFSDSYKVSFGYKLFDSCMEEARIHNRRHVVKFFLRKGHKFTSGVVEQSVHNYVSKLSDNKPCELCDINTIKLALSNRHRVSRHDKNGVMEKLGVKRFPKTWEEFQSLARIIVINSK